MLCCTVCSQTFSRMDPESSLRCQKSRSAFRTDRVCARFDTHVDLLTRVLSSYSHLYTMPSNSCKHSNDAGLSRIVSQALTCGSSLGPGFVTRTDIPDGLLPRWLLLVAATAAINGASNIFNPRASAKVYSSPNAQSKCNLVSR